MKTNFHPAERTAWIDGCKGLCIILVVYGHVTGGLEASGALAGDSFWLALRNWVYLFHMPAFFVLSGIFAPKGIRHSISDFVLGRLRTLFYPYVVWTAIIVAAQFAMARFVNNPPDWRRALHFLTEPYGYGLWFLYSLLIISLLYHFMARLKIPAPFMVLAAVVLSFLASRNIFRFWLALNTAMIFFVYYAVAACARDKILALLSRRRAGPPVLAGAGFLLMMTWLNLAGFSSPWLTGLLLAWLGIIGVVCLAKGLAQIPAAGFLTLLGFYSLEIYLGHPLWGTLSRALLTRSGVHSPAILVLGGIALGIGGSLLVGILCRTCQFNYLFRWPAKKVRPA